MMNLARPALSLLLSLSGLGLLTTPLQAQQVYKWKDEKGALHYSQTPPPARYSKAVDVKARATAAPSPAKAGSPTSPATEPAAANGSANAKPVVPASVKLSAETCKDMKANLDTLASGRRLYEKDTAGERAYMTEERRAAQIQIYQQNLSKGCQ